MVSTTPHHYSMLLYGSELLSFPLPTFPPSPLSTLLLPSFSTLDPPPSYQTVVDDTCSNAKPSWERCQVTNRCPTATSRPQRPPQRSPRRLPLRPRCRRTRRLLEPLLVSSTSPQHRRCFSTSPVTHHHSADPSVFPSSSVWNRDDPQ